MYVAFDGSLTLSFAGLPYSYNDLSNRHQGPELPFDQAARIAGHFLQENGWLTFPYTLAESDQGSRLAGVYPLCCPLRRIQFTEFRRI
jgi:hypothetical protein